MRQQLHFARSNRGAGCVSARLLMVPAAEAQTAPRGYVSTSCVLTDDVRSNVSRQDVCHPKFEPALRSSTEHLPAPLLGGRASASRRHQPGSRHAGKDQVRCGLPAYQRHPQHTTQQRGCCAWSHCELGCSAHSEQPHSASNGIRVEALRD